jgi:purine/pyrimidine-nucleoside phosphorylase
MGTLDNVSVSTKSNVYFDGKCVSHTVTLADGSRKSVGVILPSTLRFNTGAPETMELTGGKCKVKLAGAADWTNYEAGQSFDVPGNSAFDIETSEMVDYICHFG